MQFKKGFLWITGCALGVVILASSSTTKLAAESVKQALVEIVFPSHPFFTRMAPRADQSGRTAAGPVQGTLGVTNLIVTNLTNNVERIVVFQPGMSPNAADCSGQIQSDTPPGNIAMIIGVQPNQTLSLPFPSPLVFPSQNGLSCIAIQEEPGHVEVYVTGFVN